MFTGLAHKHCREVNEASIDRNKNTEQKIRSVYLPEGQKSQTSALYHATTCDSTTIYIHTYTYTHIAITKHYPP